MASKNKKTHAPEPGLPGLDMAEVERLLAFMNKHGLAEFEFSRGDLKIALKRAGTSPVGSGPARPLAGPPAGAAPVAVAGPAEASAGAAHAPTGVAEDLHVIKSPIVGTFFTAAGPDSPPFAKVGDKVKAGQVICIVEAMKLMNEIESDVSGVVVRALVENAQPVEYGQPLFAIRPDGKK